MNTVVVGLDDGTRNYLGRREQAPDRTNDPLAKAISNDRPENYGAAHGWDDDPPSLTQSELRDLVAGGGE